MPADRNGSFIPIKKEQKSMKTKQLLLVAGLVLVFILYYFQITKEEETVKVVQAGRDLTIGTVISINEDLEPYDMPISEYNRLNNLKDSSTGESLSPIILASEVSEINGFYMSSPVPAGGIMRREYVTSKTLSINPYLNNIPKDGSYEIYTLDFDSEDVNTRLLLPGSNIRVRGVLNVKAQYVEEIRDLLKAKEQKFITGAEDTLDGQSVIRTFAPTAGDEDLYATAAKDDVPVAEVLFNNIKVADLLNAKGESILEILMALSNMPLRDRVALLNTSVEDDSDTNKFAKRIKPEKLVLVVSREDASLLAEFENLGGMTFKYTLLTEDEDNSLYKQIRGVSDDIYSFIENYQPVAR